MDSASHPTREERKSRNRQNKAIREEIPSLHRHKRDGRTHRR